MMTTPQLHVTNKDYPRVLVQAISSARQRILLETMVLDHIGAMNNLLTTCLQACKRGVRVELVYDIYAHKELTVRYGVRANQRFKQLLAELEHAGATIYRVGASQINPFAGRHHAKAVIVDDNAYIGGGVNLTGDSFKTRDFMLQFHDATLAQTLFETLPQAALARTSDQVVYGSDSMEVLLDVGNRGQSLIYERVCQLAEQATKVWYISRFAPDGKLVRILQQKDARYWYNSLTSADPFGKLAIFIDQMKVKVTNNYNGKAFLHAKFCVFQLPDGHYEAISGSHNFNSRGIAFGTQELAIHTKDQALCKRLIEFATNNLS